MEDINLAYDRKLGEERDQKFVIFMIEFYFNNLKTNSVFGYFLLPSRNIEPQSSPPPSGAPIHSIKTESWIWKESEGREVLNKITSGNLPTPAGCLIQHFLLLTLSTSRTES